MLTANPSRRDFLKGTGALVVSFSAFSTGAELFAQGQFGTRESNVDPKKLDSWIAINADGTVTAHTGKCDFGQGMFTAQTQLVAEELCVLIERVKLLQCDTEITPDQGTTSGSQSSPVNFNTENLAQAAATAREALVAMAADKLGLPAEQLSVAGGIVTAKSGQHVSYEELIGDKKFNLQMSKEAKRRPHKDWVVLGKPVAALERPELMTGHFEFVQYVKAPGMVHGRVVRPPAMGAKLVHVDESSVRDVAGMVKVVVRKDFVGVVAETQYAAVQAAQKLKIEWMLGPAMPEQATFFDYLQKQQGRDGLVIDSGDVDAEIAKANKVVRAKYTYAYQMHGSVGSSCAVADVKADSATIWSGTQSVYPTRSIASTMLEIPQEKIHVIFKRGSGCYGLNGADAVTLDAAVLSQECGRPVRLQFTRRDEMMWENLGSAMVIEHRAGLRTDGTIAAWDREDWAADRGGRPGYDQPGNLITGMLLGYEPAPLNPGPAKKPTGVLNNQSNTVPAYMTGCINGVCGGGGRVASERVLMHTILSPFFTGPLRSPLRIQNTFANECFMDELALAANADPLDFRLKHLGDERVRGVLKAAAEAAGWKSHPYTPRALPKKGKVTGRGISCVAYEGHNGYTGLVVDIELDLETGVVHPKRFFCAADSGPISNPDGLKNQVEGGLLQGMSRALGEQATWDDKGITSVDWVTLNSLHLDYEMPVIVTVLLNPSDVPATGAGEGSITAAPAAIGNAIFNATGVRMRTVPFTPERVLAELHKQSKTA